MHTSEPFGSNGAEPLGPVEDGLHWLLATAMHCCIGLALGLLAARSLRARGLRWSWPASALILIVLLRAQLGVLTVTLGSAALAASARTRRWHREDLEAGADLGVTARSRRGPLDLLESCARAVPARALPRRGFRNGELVIGRDERSRVVSVPFAGEHGGTHTLVLGATGSGKTVTQTWIAARAIERGMGAVVIDPKGDWAMREELQLAARLAGRAFIEWTPSGDCTYNPYARGSDTEIADRLLAGERFTEPHYLRQAQRYLGHVVRVIRCGAGEVSLRGIVEGLDPERLEVLARTLAEPDALLTHSYLDGLSQRQRSDLAGVRDRLAIMAESDVGPWLDPQTPGATRLALLEAVRARAVVYFCLESDTRPLLAQMIGAAVVQDIQSSVAALQRQPIATLVVIDEFSAVAAEQVVRLFARARSAGFSLLLGTQELSDLRPPGGERLLEQVLGNLSLLIAHRQVVPASAEMIAAVAGGRGAWRVSRRSDGSTTRTRTREAVLDADRVTRLRPGSAAVIVPGAMPGVRIAQVFSPQSWR
jgi:hypothetical protein